MNPITFSPLGLAQPQKLTIVVHFALGIGITSFEHIAVVWDAGAWAFTIGSAFIDKKFAADGSLAENEEAYRIVSSGNNASYCDFKIK